MSKINCLIKNFKEDIMTTAKENTQHSKNEHHGKQGFASMPKEKVQEIASKGGQSHGKNHDKDNEDQDDNERKNYNKK